LKKAIDDAGLGVSEIMNSLHWGKPFSSASEKVREEGLAGMKIALEEAKFFGATSVLLVPGVVNKQISYADAYTRSQAEIRKLLPVAQETGVQIAIEEVWSDFLISPLEMARYIDEFNSPLVGAHFDIGNCANWGYPEQWIRILGKRILKLHVKEFSRKKADAEGKWKGFNLPLGDKDGIDWPEVVKALHDIGYTGWATAEVGGGDRAVLKDLAQRMDKVLQLA
jgi:hexulose-6-phosphate isomerase